MSDKNGIEFHGGKYRLAVFDSRNWTIEKWLPERPISFGKHAGGMASAGWSGTGHFFGNPADALTRCVDVAVLDAVDSGEVRTLSELAGLIRSLRGEIRMALGLE